MRSLGVVAAALLLSGVVASLPVRAASGAHASYFSESAFMTLTPGQTGQFAVGFLNAGDVTWTKGDATTGTSLHTAAPLDNTTDSTAGWAVNWIAPNVYALQAADTVAPGAVAYFVYTVKAPLTAAQGAHTFYGRPFAGSSPLEDYGYYQIATVSGTVAPQPTPTPAPPAATAPPSSTTPVNSARPAASGFSQPGTYMILVTFTKAMNAATVTSTNIRWDTSAFPGNIALQSTGTTARLDFAAGSLPAGGSHALDLLDGLTDTDGLHMQQAVTTFSVSIPVDSTAPSMSGASAPSPSTVEVTFSEPMRTIANGFASGVSIDVPGSWSILTSSGGSTGITVASAVTGGTSADADIFAERKVRLGLSAPLASGSFQVQISGVADLAGNVVSPTPASATFSSSGAGSGAPTISSATITMPTTTTPLQTFAVTFSKAMKHAGSQTATGYTACAGSGGQIDNPANYSSVATGNTSAGAELGASIQAAGTLCQISGDERTVTFQFPTSSTAPPVLPTGSATAAGTYVLTVASVQDSGGTAIAASSTVTVSGGSPALKAATFVSASVLSLTFNTKIDSSAQNPGDYKINSGSFAVLCTSGSPTIDVNNSGTNAVVTITCSPTSVWGGAGTNTVTVRDVTQLATGIVIAPNPNPARTF